MKPNDKGFSLLLTRKRQDKRSGIDHPRTVGDYVCYWNGNKIAGFSGVIAECGGPGDNTSKGRSKHVRIQAGTYRLAIQSGAHYHTYNYSKDRSYPKPGLLLLDTGAREGILLHPGVGFVSSIGCLNPSAALKDMSADIDFTDSRTRVVGIIDFLKTNVGAAFPRAADAQIPGAVVMITGEP